MKHTRLLVFLGMLTLQNSQAWSHESVLSSRGQIIYVPSYTELYRYGDMKADAVSTVNIHNIDLKFSIKVTSVKGYDTSGQLVKNYLDKPLVLGPLASKSFVASYQKNSDGTGSNFIIKWESDHVVVAPLIESFLVASTGNHGFSHSSKGRVVEELK